jgi:hypothetical protein
MGVGLKGFIRIPMVDDQVGSAGGVDAERLSIPANSIEVPIAVHVVVHAIGRKIERLLIAGRKTERTVSFTQRDLWSDWASRSGIPSPFTSAATGSTPLM